MQVTTRYLSAYRHRRSFRQRGMPPTSRSKKSRPAGYQSFSSSEIAARQTGSSFMLGLRLLILNNYERAHSGPMIQFFRLRRRQVYAAMGRLLTEIFMPIGSVNRRALVGKI